jgi:hypothetical protein
MNDDAHGVQSRLMMELSELTSDNLNKYDEAQALLEAMAKTRLGLQLFVQGDMQIARQGDLVALLPKAGCSQMFSGTESFSRAAPPVGQEGTGACPPRSRLTGTRDSLDHVQSLDASGLPLPRLPDGHRLGQGEHDAFFTGTVLMSWCRFNTGMPVTSWTIASRSGRAVSSRWVRTCLSKSLPFSAGNDLTRCCSAAVRTP